MLHTSSGSQVLKHVVLFILLLLYKLRLRGEFIVFLNFVYLFTVKSEFKLQPVNGEEDSKVLTLSLPSLSLN